MSGGLYRLRGALGSPYSVKMRAVLRYRRIPFAWSTAREAMEAAAAMPAPVIPVLEYPDGTRRNESTALIQDLEGRHPGERSVVPTDPGDAFLALLIEDFADEWLSKAMYHYRWAREVDQRQMSRWLAYDYQLGGGVAGIDQVATMFRARQVGRRGIVGSTDETGPGIEASAARVMAILEAHVVERPFLFGDRPTAAEFALYGQLAQFQSDPTPNALMRADHPFTHRWVSYLDDLSGHEGTAWRDGEAPLPGAVIALLREAGSLHLPFLAANAKALWDGADTVVFTLPDGAEMRQPPARFQGKCLAALRRAHAALPDAARRRIDPLLADAGALDILAATS